MIDSDFKLYLIEVNTNPCLETDSPLLSRIIPELINSAFRLSVDPLFPCPDQAINKRVQPHNLPQEIKFQLIFDNLVETSRDPPDLQLGKLVEHSQYEHGDLSQYPSDRNDDSSPDMVTRDQYPERARTREH